MWLRMKVKFASRPGSGRGLLQVRHESSLVIDHDRQSVPQVWACVEKNSVERPSRTINSVGPWPMVEPDRGKPRSTGSNLLQVLP